MLILNVSVQIALCCKLFVALITIEELASFMYILHMPVQVSLCCKLLITLLTAIFDAFMHRLNMLS